jgi:hypothetical protein
MADAFLRRKYSSRELVNIKTPSFSASIIVISFILLSIVIIQNELTVRDMEYSAAGIPLWKGRWSDLPERYRIYLKFEGKISREEFPVPWFGPAPPAGKEQHPIYTDVYILEGLSGFGYLPEKVYLWYGGRTNMFLANSGGNWAVGGRLVSEWSQALREEKIVEVEGYAFDVLVDGRRYTLFDVMRVIDFK